MKKIIKDCFTGIDGMTWDVGRILWFGGVVVFLACAVFALAIKGQNWDAVAYGSGLGLVLSAGAFSLKLKSTTEPK